MMDPKVWPDAATYDGERFLKMREIPEQAHKAQFVSTSVEHMGFSHGKHACPGRFIAAAEVKIILCHLIMKYDWKLVGHSNDSTNGIFNLPDRGAQVAIRRRKEEVTL